MNSSNDSPKISPTRAAALTPAARDALLRDGIAAAQSLRMLVHRLHEAATAAVPVATDPDRIWVRIGKPMAIAGLGSWKLGEIVSFRPEVFEQLKRTTPTFFVMDGVEREVLEVVTAAEVAAEEARGLPKTNALVGVRILVPVMIPASLDMTRTNTFRAVEPTCLDPDLVTALERPKHPRDPVGCFLGRNSDGSFTRAFERLTDAEDKALQATATPATAAPVVGVGDIEALRAAVAVLRKHNVFVDVTA